MKKEALRNMKKKVSAVLFFVVATIPLCSLSSSGLAERKTGLLSGVDFEAVAAGVGGGTMSLLGASQLLDAFKKRDWDLATIGGANVLAGAVLASSLTLVTGASGKWCGASYFAPALAYLAGWGVAKVGGGLKSVAQKLVGALGGNGGCIASSDEGYGEDGIGEFLESIGQTQRFFKVVDKYRLVQGLKKNLAITGPQYQQGAQPSRYEFFMNDIKEQMKKFAANENYVYSEQDVLTQDVLTNEGVKQVGDILFKFRYMELGGIASSQQQEFDKERKKFEQELSPLLEKTIRERPEHYCCLLKKIIDEWIKDEGTNTKLNRVLREKGLIGQ